MSSHEVSPQTIEEQNIVRIRSGFHLPYSGRYGVVNGIDRQDRYGSYLVQFEDGLCFRYSTPELELIPAHATAMNNADLYRRAS